MATKKVFVSYDYDNDRHYKNLLLAWDANKDFDFYLNDQSIDVSVNSTSAGTIKQAISAKINSSTYFLCIVGEKTHNSSWVSWEISKAVELKKKIVAVKTSKDNSTPSGLYNVGATWALSFNFDAIKDALK